MFKNYLTTALRNFWRNKIFSGINVLGLSIGISASLVIFLIVYYEFSFDRFEKDSNQIYRVVLDAKFNGMEGHSSGIPAPLSAAVAKEMTDVENTVPLMSFQGDGNVKVNIERNGKIQPFKKQGNIIFTNDDYFKLLSFDWLAGSAAASLQKPFGVVITESRARQYFGDITAADLIGQPIVYNNDLTANITGVVKELDEQTFFTAKEFISYATISETRLKDNFMMDVWHDWMSNSQLVIKLNQNTSVATAEKQINQLLRSHTDKAYKDENNHFGFHLQPLADIHFNSTYIGVNQRIANKKTLYGLLAIGSFLLLLGCINFINLTTAQSTKRAKEIGIRKTMGSSRRQLVYQFLGETFATTFMATLLSIAIAPVLLYVFKGFTPEGIQFSLIQQPGVILFLILLVIVVSFLSGIYPAMLLSGYKPVAVLKNLAATTSSQTRTNWMRKSLTVGQFVIAQFFVIATIMVSKQINFSLNADLGFNKDAVVNFDQPRDTAKGHTQQLLNQIKALPGVANASAGFFAPADQGMAFTNIAYFNGKETITPNVNVQIRWGDTNYLNLYQIKLLAGRNILGGDSTRELLINETYAHALGFTNAADAIGQTLIWNNKPTPIVGIMKDFHDLSMHSEINALAFAAGRGTNFHIKLAQTGKGSDGWNTTLAQIQGIFKKMYPEEDFNYRFLDESIAKLYEKEQQTATLLTWATGLAILISCMGLLGLVMHTTTTRTKEIGIRKVMGASVAHIVSILSKDFVQLVAIAFAIAAPIAWWAIQRWLQDFAYRTSISWWVFAISGIAMIVLAIITLSLQTIKAALANPVKSLRTE